MVARRLAACLALFLAVALAALASLPPARAQDPEKGTIQGVVKFKKLNAANVKITIEGKDLTTRSDAAGKFEFKDVPAGKYTLKAEGSVQNRNRSGTLADVEPTPEGKEAKPVTIELQ
jgi:hypothetical protein